MIQPGDQLLQFIFTPLRPINYAHTPGFVSLPAPLLCPGPNGPPNQRSHRLLRQARSGNRTAHPFSAYDVYRLYQRNRQRLTPCPSRGCTFKRCAFKLPGTPCEATLAVLARRPTSSNPTQPTRGNACRYRLRILPKCDTRPSLRINCLRPV